MRERATGATLGHALHFSGPGSDCLATVRAAGIHAVETRGSKQPISICRLPPNDSEKSCKNSALDADARDGGMILN